MGYDCKKLNNLCRIKSNILVYVSGNLIHFFNIDTKDIETYPSSGGQGISFVTVIFGMLILLYSRILIDYLFCCREIQMSISTT